MINLQGSMINKFHVSVFKTSMFPEKKKSHWNPVSVSNKVLLMPKVQGMLFKLVLKY